MKYQLSTSTVSTLLLWLLHCFATLSAEGNGQISHLAELKFWLDLLHIPDLPQYLLH
jgi:hypothetical protein